MYIKNYAFLMRLRYDGAPFGTNVVRIKGHRIQIWEREKKAVKPQKFTVKQLGGDTRFI
jgi:hypothetical protein